jgi:uridine kinase
MPTRDDVLRRIADHLRGRRPGHPLRVGVDGITSSGKTTLAGELAGLVGASGRTVRRVSMDGFHHPRAHRHRQGRMSADGYYEDAYDLRAARRDLLGPLGPGGDRRYRYQIIDLATDAAVAGAWATAGPADVLIVDGSFLQRPELRDGWDEVVFLDVSFDVARARGVARDAASLGGHDAAVAAFEQRYHAAGRRYLAEVDPLAQATIVIDNNDLQEPVLRRIGP